MISLFRKRSSVSRRGVVFPTFAYIRGRLQQNIDRVVDHYEFRRRRVPSNHPLVRLIQSITIPHSRETDDYIDAVNNAAPHTARTIGFGSSSQAGFFFEQGIFYGSHVKEFIYLTESASYQNLPNWKELEPIVVRYHPRSDLSFTPLLPEFGTDEGGYAVIDIDAGLLLYMYREWRKEQLKLPEENRLGVGHFVYMYILPSMLFSHMDCAWFNRIINKLRAMPSRPTIPVQGLALPTNMTYVDQVANKLVEVVTRRKYRFDALLMAIPAPFAGNLAEHTELPDQPLTRFAKGFELLATLPWIELLLAIDVQTSGNQNRAFENELRIALRRNRNERWLQAQRGNFDEIAKRIDENVIPFLDGTATQGLSMEGFREDLTELNAGIESIEVERE